MVGKSYFLFVLFISFVISTTAKPSLQFERKSPLVKVSSNSDDIWRTCGQVGGIFYATMTVFNCVKYMTNFVKSRWFPQSVRALAENNGHVLPVEKLREIRAEFYTLYRQNTAKVEDIASKIREIVEKHRTDAEKLAQLEMVASTLESRLDEIDRDIKSRADTDSQRLARIEEVVSDVNMLRSEIMHVPSELSELQSELNRLKSLELPNMVARSEEILSGKLREIGKRMQGLELKKKEGKRTKK